MKIQGSKLFAAREAAGVTRADLATVADLTHARIWQLETEPESRINVNIASAIAKALKIKVEELA